MSLHVIHGSGARVIPLPARTSGGMGDGAIATGLIRMALAAGAELRLTGTELRALETGLAPNATRAHRRAALGVLADRYADWSATPEGVAELLRLMTYLAPHVPYTDLRDIAEEQRQADDRDYSQHVRDIARVNAAFLLDRAAAKPGCVDRPQPVRITDPGPGPEAA